MRLVSRIYTYLGLLLMTNDYDMALLSTTEDELRAM